MYLVFGLILVLEKIALLCSRILRKKQEEHARSRRSRTSRNPSAVTVLLQHFSHSRSNLLIPIPTKTLTENNTTHSPRSRTPLRASAARDFQTTCSQPCPPPRSTHLLPRTRGTTRIKDPRARELVSNFPTNFPGGPRRDEISQKKIDDIRFGFPFPRNRVRR